MHSFFAVCSKGRLPSYAFLEPRFFFRPNDQHPPYGVAGGDELIRTVYEAVRRGPLWEKTLLCVTYDERGGCYDHVPPPAAAPPGDGATCKQGFRFDRLGVRVPTVLVSPWIEPGTVFRAARPLDHTSMIRTICRLWSLPSLTDRDRAAEDLGDVLIRSVPRQDAPRIPAAETCRFDIRRNWRTIMHWKSDKAREASPRHRAIVGVSGIAVQEPATVREAHRRLREVLPALRLRVRG